MIDKKTLKIKIIDFGATTRDSPDQKQYRFYGTLKYGCPEIQQLENIRKSQTQVDDDEVFNQMNIGFTNSNQEVWSLGIIFYNLVFGFDPFKYNPEDEVQTDILTKDISKKMKDLISGRCIQHTLVSEQTIDLISLMLSKNPENRISFDDIISHPYFNEEYSNFYEAFN